MRTRSWQLARDEMQARKAFSIYCNQLGLAPSPRRWEAFKKWRHQHSSAEFSQFLAYCESAYAAARGAVAALESQFRNGKKGEEYDGELNLPVAVYWLNGLEEIGLCWKKDALNPRKCRISGVPLLAGEFVITLFYRLDGPLSHYPVKTHRFKFIVNPDPRELWQNIPSDPAGEYSRPDLEHMALRCPNAQIYAASLRGRSHAHKGLPRDDAYAVGCENGWQFMAVADGAGSAEFSRKGAELACQTAMAAVWRNIEASGGALLELVANSLSGSEDESWQPAARKLAYDLLPRAAFEAHKAIRDEAAAKNREPKTYATTLLLALARKLEAGWLILSFQIGDGAMAIIANGESVLLAQPDEGEYSGQTKFLTMPEIFDPHELMRRLRVSYAENLESLILMSDGVADPKFSTQEGLENSTLWLDLKNELLETLGSPEPSHALLDWLSFWEKGHHDDRTIALLLAETS